MTLFEYLAIAFSLAFSFTTLRLVGGFTHTLNGASRYWVHAAVNLAALLMVVMVFWVFWSFRGLHWTFPKFVLALSAPSTLYFLASTVIPDDPSAVTSWREYYYSVRLKLFVVLGLWAVLIAAISTLLLEMPIAHPARIGQITMLTLAVVGIASKHPRIHAILALSMLVAILIFGLTFFSSPDGMRVAGV